LIIADAPKSLRISPIQSTYHPGVRIRCSAEGNPVPSYQWTDLVCGTVIQGADLVISEDMLDKIYAFQCTATNQYKGQKHMITGNIAFAVQGRPTSSCIYHPFIFTPTPIWRRGIVFDRFVCLFVYLSLCLFICFFVGKITRKWLDRYA